MKFRLQQWLAMVVLVAGLCLAKQAAALSSATFIYHVNFPAPGLNIAACNGPNFFTDQNISVDSTTWAFDDKWPPTGSGQSPVVEIAGQVLAPNVTATLHCTGNTAITGSVSAAWDGTSTYTGTYQFNGNNGQVIITRQTPVQPFSGNISTPVGTPVSIQLQAAVPPNAKFVFTITGEPLNGSRSNFDPAKGTLTYTPNPGFNGVDAFAFTCDEGNGGPATSVPYTINVGSGGGGNKNDVTLTSVLLTPNPSKVGDTVKLSGQIVIPAGKTVPASAMGTVDWGDGSPTFTLQGTPFIAQFKTGAAPFTHVFTATGVYDVHIHLFDTDHPDDGGLDFDFPQVVGDAPVSVDASTGAVVSAMIGNGGVTLNINAQKLGAAGASTTFEDANGTPTQIGLKVLQGFTVQQTIGQQGLYVATTQLMDAANNVIGMTRKTIGLGGQDVGDSSALMPPSSTKINLTSMSGKFVFSSAAQDKVLFAGTVALPQGFSLALPVSSKLIFGMGNVVDTVTLNTKGVSTGSARSRLKSFQLSVPKLTGPGGVAKGGETAKVKATLSAMDLSKAGFDTDGINATKAPGETNQKNLNRFIQVNMLMAGVSYESLIPVTFQLGKDNGFGSIGGRH